MGKQGGDIALIRHLCYETTYEMRSSRLKCKHKHFTAPVKVTWVQMLVAYCRAGKKAKKFPRFRPHQIDEDYTTGRRRPEEPLTRSRLQLKVLNGDTEITQGKKKHKVTFATLDQG